MAALAVVSVVNTLPAVLLLSGENVTLGSEGAMSIGPRMPCETSLIYCVDLGRDAATARAGMTMITKIDEEIHCISRTNFALQTIQECQLPDSFPIPSS